MSETVGSLQVEHGARQAPLQRNTPSLQRDDLAEYADPLQQMLDGSPRVLALQAMQASLNRPAQSPAQRKANRSDLPDHLHHGIEALSGISMDGVRVHRNSAEPAKLGALATAQGAEIHLGPGQEQHLPHEAWHVVQQAQGRVKPTTQRAGVAINDSPSLEAEADRMGGQAMAVQAVRMPAIQRLAANPVQPVMQRKVHVNTPNLRDLSDATQAKVLLVREAVQRMGRKDDGDDISVEIYVVQMPSEVNTNPADTRMEDETIIVRLQLWYVDGNSVGDIIGLIGHELGVHDLANARIGKTETDRETDHDAESHLNLNIGGKNRRLEGWPTADKTRQKDHINVAKFKEDGTPSPRMAFYIETMLKLGDSIEDQYPGEQEKATRETVLRDMYKTFLFDMSRMIATDDGAMWAIATGLKDISDVHRWLDGELRNKHAKDHPWLNEAIDSSASVFSIAFMLAGKAISALWQQRGAIIPTAVNSIAGLFSPAPAAEPAESHID